jgi:hypothetical protein
MVLGNHRGSIEFHGLFHSQIAAINTIDLARYADRGYNNPLEWKLVDDPKSKFCNRLSVQAYDDTRTTTWIIFEVNDPVRSLDVMINNWDDVVKVDKTASEAWDDYFESVKERSNRTMIDVENPNYFLSDEPLEQDGF